MAIKVRCDGCRRKISVDEAFAGGVCRCPYCGATTSVPGPVHGGAARPRPDRPDRPDVPEAPAPSPPAQAPVPMAKPVLIQGIAAIVMALLLVALVVAVGVVIATMTLRGRGDTVDAPPPQEPIVGVKGMVAGMPVATPVVFLIDGAGAGDVADVAGAMARHYVIAADASKRFNLIFIREEGLDVLAETWTLAGSDGDAKVKAFLAERIGGGATALAGAFDKAIALKPASVVLLSAKGPADADAVAARLRTAGIKFYGVSLGGYEDAHGPMKALAEQTGGGFREYTLPELQEYITDAPLLP